MNPDFRELRSLIESAYESRAEITPETASAPIRAAVEAAVVLLDAGTLRVAEKNSIGQCTRPAWWW